MTSGGTKSHAGGARREVAERMSDAARTWLADLDDAQRAIANGAVPGDDASDDERRRWFYTPTDHGGLTLHQQRPAQQRAVMRLVSTGLSTAGYVTVATILGLENILDQREGFIATFGRERGRDPGLYYLRVFGDPGGTRPWGWRFGGHHVSLHNLIVDGELAATTPCFLGANPAVSPLLGGALNRPLGRVEDLARDLVRSLSPELAARAVVATRAPSDIVTENRTSFREGDRGMPWTGLYRGGRNGDRTTGPASEVLGAVPYTPAPKGVAAADLDEEQRELLRMLLGTYFDRVPNAVSPNSRYDDDAVLDGVHFAWAGPMGIGEPHYYRLQGDALLAEWDNTQSGANHAHSVWRDPTSDFGLDVLAGHRAAHEH